MIARCLLALLPVMTFQDGEVLQPGYTEHRAVSFGAYWKLNHIDNDTIKDITFSYYHADSTAFGTCHFTSGRAWPMSVNRMQPHNEYCFVPSLKVGKPIGIYSDTLIVDYTYGGEAGQFRLPIRQAVGETREVYIHRGEHFTFHGREYTESGEYFDEESVEVLKLHVIEPCEVHIEAPSVLCEPGEVTLTTSREGDYYLWRGYGITDSTSRNAIAQLDTVGTIPYTITVTTMTETGENLIYNGDFEQGPQGFSTQYRYLAPYFFASMNYTHISSGRYSIVAWPRQVNNPWYVCEHDGYMMVVDGSSSSQNNPDKVFGTTVRVEPNTNYAFSAEIVAVSVHSPSTAPNLQFYINGETFSEVHQPSMRQCEWSKIYKIWNSGDLSGDIDISLLDHNRYSGGNDFAVDNISFRPLCIAEDTIHIHVGDTTLTRATENITTCDSILWNGHVYKESGVYRFDTTSVFGCDSVVTLRLAVHPSYHIEETAVACDSFEWKGHMYHQSGEYRFDTTSVFGCDSVVTLRLTVHPSYHIEETAIACDSFEWKGHMYYHSGEYRFDTTSVFGCDSVVTLHLTVHPSYHIEETAIACDSFEWKGHMYYQSGAYRFDTTTIYGCDSVVTLCLTVHPSYHIEETAIACDSFAWKGHMYYQSGAYRFDTTTVYGCDSVEMLYLTIHDCSFKVNLQPVTEVCADEGALVVNYTYEAAYQGPDRVSVTLTPDILSEPAELTDTQVVIPLPTDIRPDYYEGHVLFMSDYDSAAFDINFLVRYPASVFYQKWNNVLSLQNKAYNGGYEWDDYRWRMDNVELPNERHSYIYMGVGETLQMGHEYVAYLRRVGEDYYIPTCAFVPTEHVDSQDYPTIYSGIELVAMPEHLPEDYEIYDLLGRRVRECTRGGLYIYRKVK